MKFRFALVLLMNIVMLHSAPNSDAQVAKALGGTGATNEDLAKATQNPVADLVSVPLQFNWYSGGDIPDGRTLSVLNVQPVFPLPITDRWNLIARTIVPIMNVPLANDERSTGIGDIQGQFFFAPVKSSGVIWGLGPVLSFPTATNEAVNTGQFAAGPTAVVLAMPGSWVIGTLANSMWRIGGSDTGPAIHSTLVQPFINLNFKRGWSLSYSPVITANWNAASGDEWTVPVGLGVSKVAAVGTRPVSLSLQYYRNAVRPPGAGEHQVRMVVSLLYPKAKS